MESTESTYSLLKDEDIFIVKEHEPIISTKTNKQENPAEQESVSPKAKVKEILFLVNTENTGKISEGEKDVISRLLKALQLPETETELTAVTSLDCKAVIHDTPYTKITAFGFTSLEKEFPVNSISAFNGKKILNAYPLLKIDTNNELKKAFWQKLQELVT